MADLTTQLSVFLQDLWANTIGANTPLNGYANQQTLTTGVTIPTGKNAVMVGPSITVTGSLTVVGTSHLRVL